MDEIALPDAIEPTEWFVVFHTKAMTRWLAALACGRFKHVSAWAYIPGHRIWLVYDAQWRGLRLQILTHDAAKAVFRLHTADAAIVKVKRHDEEMNLSSRLCFDCVTATKHLLGVRCHCWRPDALYRHLLRNGGELVDGHQPPTTSGRSEPRR